MNVAISIPWILFFLYTTKVDSILNLNLVRQGLITTPPQNTQKRDTTYFYKDMDIKFMPLCGNGKLDTKHDYEVYYSDKYYNSIFQVSESIILKTTEASGKKIGVKIFIDEICDDGNRKDGDGCSADCLSRDKMDSACEIEVNWPSKFKKNAVYDAIAFRDHEPYVVFDQTISLLHVDSKKPGAMQPIPIVSLEFETSAMFIFKDVIYIYSAFQRSVYSYSLTNSTPLKIIYNSNLGQNKEPGHFFVNDNILYLACKDNWSAILLSVSENSCTLVYSISPVGGLNPLKAFLQIDKNCLDIKLKGKHGYRDPTVTLCTNSVPVYDFQNSTDTTLTNNLWVQGLQIAFANSIGINYEYSKTNYSFRFLNESSHEILGEQIEKQDNLLMVTMFLQSQFFLLQTQPTMRNRFFSSELVDAISSAIYIGDQLIKTAALTSDYICGNSPCALDFHTTYDVLLQNPNSNVAVSDPTFNTILNSMFLEPVAPASIDDYNNVYNTMIQYENKLSENGYSPKIRNIATQPTTGKKWFTKGNKIIEVSNTGAFYEVSRGKCVPALLGPCKSCFFYQQVGPCIPCSYVIPKNDSLEWNLQCGNCSTSRNRRLLETNNQTLTISFTLRNSNINELLVLFPTAQINNNMTSDNNSFTVFIQTLDPAETLRLTQAVIINHENWKVDIQPRIIYTSKYFDTEKATNVAHQINDNSMTFLGGLIAGILFLFFLLIGLYIFYHHQHNPKKKNIYIPLT